MGDGRLIVVSNRLPVAVVRRRKGWSVEPTIGGLASALTPMLQKREGIWIGWLGTTDEGLSEDLLAKASRVTRFGLKPVEIPRGIFEQFYHGISNQVLWPLFHDMVDIMRPMPRDWDGYIKANRLFAKAIASLAQYDDFIWIHDYHLMLVTGELKKMGLKNPTGFFLHIPFPQPDILIKVPWWRRIIVGLLHHDLVGFQSQRDLDNFLQCLEILMEHAPAAESRGNLVEIVIGKRCVHAGVFPISVDFKEISKAAESETVQRELDELRGALGHRMLVLGVDRLDYTKGIPNRLKAFEEALLRFSDLREKVVMMQLTAPSREDIPSYSELKDHIHRMVGEINGRMGTLNWTPIQYLYQAMPRERLLALYRAAHVAFITPLKDGMNLIAKEFCSCRADDDGVLILSRFAGAAERLHDGALLVNPWDIEGMTHSLYRALNMPRDEKARRMNFLRKLIEREDVHWWVDRFLDAARIASQK